MSTFRVDSERKTDSNTLQFDLHDDTTQYCNQTPSYFYFLDLQGGWLSIKKNE